MFIAKYHFVSCYRDEIDLKEGQDVELVEKGQVWSLVSVDGGKGYVPTSYITKYVQPVFTEQNLNTHSSKNKPKGFKQVMHQLSAPVKYIQSAAKTAQLKRSLSNSYKLTQRKHSPPQGRSLASAIQMSIAAPNKDLPADPKPQFKQSQDMSSSKLEDRVEQRQPSTRNATLSNFQWEDLTSYDSDETLSVDEMSDEEEYLVVFNHKASKSKDDYELSITKGELVRLVDFDERDNRWCWVVNEKMDQGFVPWNCLIRMDITTNSANKNTV